MTAEELNRVINTLIAIKDEDEFYIKAYAEELIKAYAKVCVIEELEDLVIHNEDDFDRGRGKHILWRRVEQLEEEINCLLSNKTNDNEQ